MQLDYHDLESGLRQSEQFFFIPAGKGRLRRAKCSEVMNDISIQSGHLGGKDSRTYKKGVYNALRSADTLKREKFQVSYCLEHSNGRCPGCDYFNLVEEL